MPNKGGIMIEVFEVQGLFNRVDFYAKELSRANFEGKIHYDQEKHLFLGDLKDKFGESILMGFINEKNEIRFMKYYKRAHYFFYVARKDDNPKNVDDLYNGQWTGDDIDDPPRGLFEIHLRKTEEVSNYKEIIFQPIVQREFFSLKDSFFNGISSPEKMFQYITTFRIFSFDDQK